MELIAPTALRGYSVIYQIIPLVGVNVYGISMSLELEQEKRKQSLLSSIAQRKQLQHANEKAKVDQLLHSVLPHHIADRLKKKKNNTLVIADDFTDVTVFVCDIVNFTRTSSGLSPLEVNTNRN